MDKNEINIRVCQWIEYQINAGVYKSEAEYLREHGFGVGKISDARSGKAGFKAIDIGNILIQDSILNADWIMTGRGEMLLSEKKMPEQELASELKRVNKNYDEMKKERDEWYFKARKCEEELLKYRSAKTDEAV